MNTQPSITFKAKLGDDLRRWTASGDTSFAEVHQRVSDLFNIPLDSAVMRYTDDEGDLITMVCDEDLAEAIAVLATDSSTKVVLRLDITSKPKKADAKPAAAPAHCPMVEQAAKHAEKAVAHAAKEAEKAALAAKEAAKSAALHASQMGPHDVFGVLSNVHAELAKAGLDHSQLTSQMQAAMGNLQASLPAVVEQVQQHVTAALTPRSQIHNGVTCDGCEMTPLVGVRFKKRGENFDLCEQDFNKLPASERELFMRINRPEQPWRPQRNPQCSVKPQARFVEHVNLPDGTEILPGTEFTKIWRLRNTGDQAWPENTRLVFTGGDKFVGDDYAEVAPAPAGSEVEVAISLTAPTEPGRYVSYWRLAVPPAMRKFGQRIWVQVLIVRADGSMTFEESEQVQHENVQCDLCDVVPIMGERFHKKGQDYDLCTLCFDGLDEHARCEFELIARPGEAAVDMNPDELVSDELEARHGWDANTVASVQASPLAQLVEQLQSALSSASFMQLTQAIEPMFSVPEKFMKDCLKSIEPVLASMSEANAQEKLRELHVQVEDLMANPKKAAKAAKQMAKAAEAEMKKATKSLAKEAKKAAKQMKKAMKAEEKAEEQAFMEAVEDAEVVQDPYAAQDVYGEEEMEDAIDAISTSGDAAPVCSMQEALAEMGIQQADLTTSMFAEIEQVVNSEAEAAAARAEADAIAQSEVEAAMAEAQATFEAALAEEAAAAEAAAAEAAAKAAAEEAAAKAAEEEAAAMAAEEVAAKAAAEEAAAMAAAEEVAAAAEAAEKAAAEEAAAKAAAEEEAAKAAAEEAAAKAAAEEEAAKAAAEEEAAKAAAEAEAAAKAAAEESLAEQLVGMGFEHSMALNAIQASNGDMSEAINFILQQPAPEEPAPEEAPAPEPEWLEEWDQMLEELVEMGFECEDTNRAMISEHKGNLKDAVKGLVDHERQCRKPSPA